MVIPNAVLSDINFPSYESRATSSNDFNARAAKAAAADLKTLMMALDVYRLDNFHYPSTEQGLAALVWRPVGLPAPGKPSFPKTQGEVRDCQPNPAIRASNQ